MAIADETKRIENPEQAASFRIGAADDKDSRVYEYSHAATFTSRRRRRAA